MLALVHRHCRIVRSHCHSNQAFSESYVSAGIGYQIEYMKRAITAMIGDKCYQTFFWEGNFIDVPCLKYSISKALGYGIMIGSGIMKMPQIIKIMINKDVTGINAVSFYMECAAFLPSIVYNILKGYPISTYGENVVILAQNFFLVLLFWMSSYFIRLSLDMQKVTQESLPFISCASLSVSSYLRLSSSTVLKRYS